METITLTGIFEVVVTTTIWVAITVSLATAWILEQPKNWIIDKLERPYDIYASKMLYCSQCIGFWIGLFGAIIQWPTWINFHPTWLVPVLHGFIISFLSYTISSLAGLMKEE